MTDQVMQTGAVLVLFYLTIVLDGIVAYFFWQGIWLMAVLFIPLAAIHVIGWQLWKTR